MDEKVQEIASRQDEIYLDLSDRLSVIDTMMRKVLKQNIEEDVKTNTNSTGVEGQNVNDINVGTNVVDMKAADSVVIDNKMNSTQVVDEKHSVDETKKQQHAPSTIEKFISLLKKIDFESDAWLNLAPERKLKLTKKLESYGIDLDELKTKEDKLELLEKLSNEVKNSTHSSKVTSHDSRTEKKVDKGISLKKQATSTLAASTADSSTAESTVYA